MRVAWEGARTMKTSEKYKVRQRYLDGSDLYTVVEALRALEVVEARARTWAVRPYCSREDVESLDQELRLLELGLAVGQKRGLYENGTADALWAQLFDWCAKPYVSREERLAFAREAKRKRARLERVRDHLQREDCNEKVVPMRKANQG